MNYTYLLECSDGTLYCGWTNDLEKRVKAHNSGRVMQAMDLDSVKDFVSVDYYMPPENVQEEFTLRFPGYTKFVSQMFETKEEAMSREVKVKQLSRKQKYELVAHGPVEKPIF